LLEQSNHLAVAFLAASMALYSACATRTLPKESKRMPVSEARARTAQTQATRPERKVYKRKIAIGRFSNESRYGRGILVDSHLDPLGKQASDVLSSQLTRTQRFLVFERPDVTRIQEEQERAGGGSLVGVDTLILGSVTEFGRATEGKKGFMSSTKLQRVRAAVTLRLVDVATGRVFHAADGVGESAVESREVAGYGSRAAYDSTLNEQAITAAVSDVLDDLVSKLNARPWRTFILAQEEGQVFVSGGSRQGLSVGDHLVVMRRGRSVTSGQTGLPIELPGKEVARLEVVSQFGEDEVSEGSACRVVTGSIPGEVGDLFVVEDAESS
jgi:curli biogenesis system outer membrane secretion channel CsgG